MMLYPFATTLLKPLVDLYLHRRLQRDKEDAARFPERLGIASLPRPKGKLIWCHAASVGEALSVLRLLDEIRRFYPTLTILLTSGTVSSARLVAKRLPSGVVHQFAPVDIPAYTARFMAHWRPDLALWLESELWPNLLTAIRQRGTPTILLNGRMSTKSFRQWRWLKPWIKKLLSTFTIVLAQTQQAADYYQRLGAHDVRLIGNLKYTAEAPSVDASELARLRIATSGRPIWLMAATHPGEDEIAIAAHRELINRHPNLLTIIVPRHVQRAADITRLAEAASLDVAQRSKGQAITPATGIYLADTMGEMGLFYSLAKLCCIGGSFTWGGHNPIEAAQLGCPMIFGPKMTNFPDIAAEFLGHQAALMVNSPDELTNVLERLLAEPQEAINLAAHASALLTHKENILPDTMVALRPWLDQLAGQS